MTSSFSVSGLLTVFLAGILPTAFCTHTNSLALHLTETLPAWRFTNGPEFPGATGKMELQTDALRVQGNFIQGGSYVGAVIRTCVDFGQLHFRVKTDAKDIAVRFSDADGQTHQHFLKLSGNPEVWQELTVAVAGSPKHHWGGTNDGMVRRPIREIGFITHAVSFHEKIGNFLISDVRLEKIAENTKLQAEYCSDRPEKNFIPPGCTEPIRIKLLLPLPLTEHFLAYQYRDYDGKTVSTGIATFDTGRQELLIPPPQKIGYYDLLFPELSIYSGVVVDKPFIGKPDEYFAVDSSFSWGGAPWDDAKIRSYLRILKQNGIVWNRDRIDWEKINSEPGKYNLVGPYLSRFELYRKIAMEEGIKTLDTFHSTPKWNSYPHTSSGTYNKYPRDLISAAVSWGDIVRRWNRTLKALEIWNEPDIGFGNSYPAEFVTAFTKAISWQFAVERLDCKVVGGVFAWPREGSNFYRLYLENGLLDDIDALSFHTYNNVKSLENPVRLMRETELTISPRRAGIPYWMTESGMPWKRGSHRATPADDRNSAAEIAGKAAEYRALGFERYFAFEFKYYDEHEKNFGMMDRNFAPMRSMAAYTHAVRELTGKNYIGDLRISGVVRSRVFSDGQEAVAVLYNGVGLDKTDYLLLPAGLRFRQVVGIDGRLVEIRENRIPMADGLVYLHARHTDIQRFLNTCTVAMKLYQLARRFDTVPRAAKPVVIQPDYQLDKQVYSCYGYELPRNRPIEFVLRFNNLASRKITVEPRLEMPQGIRVEQFSSKPVTLPPRTGRQFKFAIVLDATPGGNRYLHFRLKDKRGNATPIAFAVRPDERLTIDSVPISAENQKLTSTFLNASTDWIILKPENWHGWQGGEIDCNIKAKFRLFHINDRLQLQVLVEDPTHSCNYSAAEAWNGDSIQFALHRRIPGDGKTIWQEFCAARSQDGEVLYRHIGNPTGPVTGANFRLLQPEKGQWLYVVNLPSQAFDGKPFEIGNLFGFSLVVNSNNGKLRDGYLTWGGGIADDKNSAVFNHIRLVQ